MKQKVVSVIAIVTLLVTVAMVNTFGVSAAQGNTTLNFTPPGSGTSTTYQMQVGITGNGSVFDGTQQLAGGITYQLQAGQSKTFRVQAQPGYVLQSVIFDGVDITSQVDVNGYITVQGKTYNTQLSFTFVEDGTSGNTGGMPNNTTGGITGTATGSTTGGNIKTGDHTPWIALTAIFVVSSTVMVVMVYRKKKASN